MNLKTAILALACAGIFGATVSTGVGVPTGANAQVKVQVKKMKFIRSCATGFKRSGTGNSYLCWRNVTGPQCRIGYLASVIVWKKLRGNTYRIEYRCTKKPG